MKKDVLKNLIPCICAIFLSAQISAQGPADPGTDPMANIDTISGQVRQTGNSTNTPLKTGATVMNEQKSSNESLFISNSKFVKYYRTG